MLKARFFKKAFADTPILAVAMISLTALITHGLMIPRLGYYYDDWYMLWSGASRGAGSLVGLFSIDRPFMGVIYSYFYRVIGESFLGWHIFALLLRIAGGIAFYWILSMVWPKLKRYFVLAAMIFVVFPGFLAEPNAATKVNHLIGYGAALFSIAFTLQAVKTSHRVWKYACIAISVLLMAFYVWIYEYMIGLEVMRVILLFWLLWQDKRENLFPVIKKVVLFYIPYFLVAIAFLYWRAKIFESTRPATDFKGLVDDYQADFFGMVIRQGFQIIKDFFSASTFAWAVQPYALLKKAAFNDIITAFVFAGGVVIIAVAYIYATRKPENPDQENQAPFVLVIIGGLITAAAVAPVVLSNRFLDLMDPYKSYALHPSAGVMIMVVGIVAMMKPKFRMAALIALLGFSVATQSLNIQEWAKLWEIQKGTWWQLTWRAPNIRDNTLVMAYAPQGYGFQQDYEVWGPLNLIYHPEFRPHPLLQSEVLNQDTVLLVSQGADKGTIVRDIPLPRDYKKYLLISQPTTSSCIHVIDGTMPAYSANERLIVEKAGVFSQIDRIETAGTPPVPPAAIFGKEPEHGWCYYFQQASLARQVGDWERIGKLYDTAVSAGLKPGDPSEYFVFIEGLVNLGREDEAKKIANNAIRENDALKYSLCKSLASAPQYPDSFGYQTEQINEIVCGK